MKKNLEKIFASASLVVAIILIMILLVTAFGGITTEEFNSNLVKGLVITLAVLYFILAITSLVFIFINSDVVKEIIVRSKSKGSIKVSIGVVRKLVRETCAKVEGVKCKKVTLVTNEYGVRLKVNVRVVGKDVVDAETYIRTLLEDEFLGALGFRFHAIEIKVISLQPRYVANEKALMEKADVEIAEIKAEEAEYAKVELSEENKDATNVMNVEDNAAIDPAFSVVPEDAQSEEIKLATEVEAESATTVDAENAEEIKSDDNDESDTKKTEAE